MEFPRNLRSECYYEYGSVIGYLKLGIESERTNVSGLSEVKGIREDDIMISKCQLNIVLVNGEDIPESRAVQLAEQQSHARQNLLEKV